ncbi:hypothetical protein KUT71_00310 [Pseudomonas aeruginosa]|nr:hypothetical protein [Pseudomonas aeruginosa]
MAQIRAKFRAALQVQADEQVIEVYLGR